jgi:sigma-B regulation protein RsbU (phosphoserine phosphatase)
MRPLLRSQGGRKIDPELLKSPILIVDDIDTNRLLIAHNLHVRGYSNMAYAEDGIEALEIVAAFRPDLVILDINMPRLDGFEVCRRLRSAPETEELPILIQTGTDNPSVRRDIFEAGASDFLSKPIDGDELIARATIQLDRRALIRGLRKYHERTSEELRAARVMQSSINPSIGVQRSLSEKYGLEIAGYAECSSELGGDFWGLGDLGHGRISVFIVDCSGHGVTAALNAFRLHALLAEFAALRQEPARLLGALNGRLVDLLQPGQFATMLSGVIDLGAKTVRYAAAGSPPPIFRSSHAAPLDLIDCAGVPLGITEDAFYTEHDRPFDQGGMLFLYSDGLTDLVDDAGRRIGESRLLEVVRRESAAPTATDLLTSVRAAFARELEKPLVDDLTILGVGWKQGPA